MTTPFIPFANPKAAYTPRKQEILKAVARAFDSGCYILGAEVESFEKAFADYLGLVHAVGCASGTDAIELALRGLGAGPGKAIFTVSHTAVATVAAIERAGGVPVLVDIDPTTYTMDSRSLETAIKDIARSRMLEPSVIIPVHLYGHPCDMDALLAVANTYGCAILEDCAQAHGARYKGRIVGTMGKAASFSFYPTKNLGALGDGGGVATNDATLAEKILALRQYGWKERYISATPGINSRLDPVQAAILAVQLEYLDADNAARRRVASIYADEISECGLVLPAAASWAEHVFHLYVVQCPERAAFMAFLKERGIGTAIHYPAPVHLQPAYKDRILLSSGGLPVTEDLAGRIVSLPMFPQLSDEDADRVCSAVRTWAKAGS
jgi:dTDP-4-amino-4,6-dideoxygalactose transaminase